MQSSSLKSNYEERDKYQITSCADRRTSAYCQ